MVGQEQQCNRHSIDISLIPLITPIPLLLCIIDAVQLDAANPSGRIRAGSRTRRVDRIGKAVVLRVFLQLVLCGNARVENEGPLVPCLFRLLGLTATLRKRKIWKTMGKE